MEAVVSRMKTVQASRNRDLAESAEDVAGGMRLVAVSATIPNVQDVSSYPNMVDLVTPVKEYAGHQIPRNCGCI